MIGPRHIRPEQSSSFIPPYISAIFTQLVDICCSGLGVKGWARLYTTPHTPSSPPCSCRMLKEFYWAACESFGMRLIADNAFFFLEGCYSQAKKSQRYLLQQIRLSLLKPLGRQRGAKNRRAEQRKQPGRSHGLRLQALAPLLQSRHSELSSIVAAGAPTIPRIAFRSATMYLSLPTPHSCDSHGRCTCALT